MRRGLAGQLARERGEWRLAKRTMEDERAQRLAVPAAEERARIRATEAAERRAQGAAEHLRAVRAARAAQDRALVQEDARERAVMREKADIKSAAP